MSTGSEGFENLASFCDDNFEDSWEKEEAKEEYDPERYQEKEPLSYLQGVII